MVKLFPYLAIALVPFCCRASLADENSDAEARRLALHHSYGTYAGEIRTPDGHMDTARLLAELAELHANTYNWLISRANTDWDDLHTFLPLAKARGIEVINRAIMPEELGSFSECFITGTAAEVTPVSEIGEHRYKPGKITETLLNDYMEVVKPKKRVAAE